MDNNFENEHRDKNFKIDVIDSEFKVVIDQGQYKSIIAEEVKSELYSYYKEELKFVIVLATTITGLVAAIFGIISYSMKDDYNKATDRLDILVKKMAILDSGIKKLKVDKEDEINLLVKKLEYESSLKLNNIDLVSRELLKTNSAISNEMIKNLISAGIKVSNLNKEDIEKLNGLLFSNNQELEDRIRSEFTTKSDLRASEIGLESKILTSENRSVERLMIAKEESYSNFVLISNTLDSMLAQRSGLFRSKVFSRTVPRYIPIKYKK